MNLTSKQIQEILGSAPDEFTHIDLYDDDYEVYGEGTHNLSDLREILELRRKVEILRMQLSACGVVAIANTPESANKARAMHPEYMSASCQDVMEAVDREMALRDQMSRQAEPIHNQLQEKDHE